MKVRRAAFAGSWYPASAEACRKEIQSFFEAAPQPPPGFGEPLGGIVPHAGWTFSGRLAGMVVGFLKGSPPPETVLLFGGHLGPSDPHLLMVGGAWDTPFGPLEVDEELAGSLCREFRFHLEEGPRSLPDNTRELQLPLLAFAFPGVRILPIAPAPTDEGILIGKRCAETALALRRRVLVIGSTDLTHYGPGYGFTPKGRGGEAEQWVRQVQDPRVIRRMEEMDPEGILQEALSHRNACCPGAAAAAVACAKALGARVARVLDYATSSDVLPSEDFVGYVAVVFGTGDGDEGPGKH